MASDPFVTAAAAWVEHHFLCAHCNRVPPSAPICHLCLIGATLYMAARAALEMRSEPPAPVLPPVVPGAVNVTRWCLNCQTPLPNGWASVYCTTQCAREDA